MYKNLGDIDFLDYVLQIDIQEEQKIVRISIFKNNHYVRDFHFKY